RNISGATARPDSSRATGRKPIFLSSARTREPICRELSLGQCGSRLLQHKDLWLWVPAFAGTTRRNPYRPIASAIRPSVPTITRHHANSVKPWRVTYVKNDFTTIIAVTNDTT